MSQPSVLNPRQPADADPSGDQGQGVSLLLVFCPVKSGGTCRILICQLEFARLKDVRRDQGGPTTRLKIIAKIHDHPCTRRPADFEDQSLGPPTYAG